MKKLLKILISKVHLQVIFEKGYKPNLRMKSTFSQIVPHIRGNYNNICIRNLLEHDLLSSCVDFFTINPILS